MVIICRQIPRGARVRLLAGGRVRRRRARGPRGPGAGAGGAGPRCRRRGPAAGPCAAHAKRCAGRDQGASTKM